MSDIIQTVNVDNSSNEKGNNIITNIVGRLMILASTAGSIRSGLTTLGLLAVSLK